MAVTVNNQSPNNGEMVFGTWTHTEGAALETLKVGGYVYGGMVLDCDSSGQIDIGVGFSISRSTTTGISTITFAGNGAVTDGRFIFWVSGM